jgi:hypothetical protein
MDAPTPAKAPRPAHIRPALRAALVSLVHEGLTITAAAEKAGLQRESLSKALKKPHVQLALSDVRRAWSSNETAKAWLVVARLADGAASEDVQLKAARTILDAAGELTGDKGRDAPKAQQLVQIILSHDGARGVSVSSGVIESPPFAPLRERDDD